MKYLIIIVFTVSVNCFLPSQTQTKSEKAQDRWTTLYVYCFAMYNAWTEVTTVTDNKDGTVRILVEGVNPCGGRKFITDKLLKKCIQGQLYRSAQNDCKGTGTAADYYGAQKFQWCPTDDESCDSSGDADVNKSPAGNSCDKDMTANRKWQIFDTYPLNQKNINEFINRDEIPKEFFWINLAPTSRTSQAGVTYLSNIDAILFRNKSSMQFLLCSK